MKETRIQAIGILALTAYLIGAPMVEAAERSSAKDWITIEDSLDQMKVSFPHHPVETTFDLPFKNTPAQGHVHLYSSATETGVFILSAIADPVINEKMLDEKAFRQAFDHYLVPRLFYSPAQFKQHQSFKSSPTQFRDHAALTYQYTYKDKNHTRLLKGLAIVRGQTLYTLFYLVLESNYQEAEWQHFVQSFEPQKS